MWRLHFLYVALATKSMKIAEAGTASVLANSDIQLAIRFCGAAALGRLTQREAVLARLVKPINGRYTIGGRHLPFVRLLLEADHHRTKNIAWLKRILERKVHRSSRTPWCVSSSNISTSD
jgi:hypothetical protein